MTRSRTLLAPLCAALALLAVACSGGEKRALATTRAKLATPSTCAGNGAHGKHVQELGLDCAVCHPSGAEYGFGTYTYPGGTTTAGGTITRSAAGGPTTCSVACHSPLGGPPHEVAWATSGPLACTTCHDATAMPAAHPPVSPSATRADCQACHVTSGHTGGTVALVGHAAGWMDQASAGFHAFSAERGLASCQGCHAQDLTGGAAGVSCASCHDRADPTRPGVSWKVSCFMCHGGLDNPSSAPPVAIWGYGNDPVRVGAHTSHVTASAISPAFACNQCHVRPTDVFSPGHIDAVTDPGAVPLATLTFNGLASLGTTVAPAWNRASATCSNTYCHGATLGGGSNTAPIWTRLDGSQAACGTCHGTPPPAPHPAVSGGTTACNPCHPATIDASGVIIPPAAAGKHLDGIVEASGHPATWMSQADAGFHAYTANLGLAACASCHGADLSGGTAGVACATCHDANLPAGVTSWKVNCVMCHGGTDGATGAPPRTVWGQSADAVRVGAHTLHVAGGATSSALDCGVCHVKPADALASGHIDGATATVTFAGLALTGGVQPAWNRAGASCASTYCHGNFTNGNTGYAPSWTSPAANPCGTCHGLPPGGTHPTSPACGSCHAGYTATSVNLALHLNGAVNVLSFTCTSCHGDPARQPTARNPQLAAAPPIDTLGRSDVASAGVGAHQLHLQPGPAATALACTECHAVPTSMTHANGAVDLAFGALASAGGTLTPAYDSAARTCASTYCHGGFQAGNATYAPVWTSPRANACGTCHGIPPPAAAGHPQNANCGGCHTGYTATSANPATHVNGLLDVAATSCTSCHGDSARVAVAGADTNVKAAPPFDVSGSATGPAVGAHLAHVNRQGGQSHPFACATCHNPVPTSTSHATGTVAVGFSGLALPLSPTGPTPGWNGTSCAATYCHGNFAGLTGSPFNYFDPATDGKLATVSWTSGPMTCQSCHSTPPASHFIQVGAGPLGGFMEHSGGNTCDTCHPGVNTAGTGFTDPAWHVNGVIDETDCTACH